MSTRDKYLKYKQKYLQLKKLNIKQSGGDFVKTVPNDGTLEGMSFQCFFISILQYLRKNGYTDMTLRQLREIGDLYASTEHLMFDIDYKEGDIYIYYDAAEKIAAIFHIQIIIYTTDRYGKLKMTSGERAHFGKFNPEYPVVNIAQFGTAHFEWIPEPDVDVEDIGQFEPGMFIGEKLHRFERDELDTNKELLDNLEELTKNQEILQVYIRDLKEYNKLLTENKKSITDIDKLANISIATKTKIKDDYTKEIRKIEGYIKTINGEIQELVDTNSALQAIIEGQVVK